RARFAAHSEERPLLAERLGGQLPQCGVIVEYEEAAAERRGYQIGFALLNLEVANRNGRNTLPEPDPAVSTIGGERETEFCSEEQQVGIHVILDDGPGWIALRKIADDARPRAAEVGALEDVRFEIAALEIIQRDEHCVRTVRRREDVGDVGQIWHA